MRGAQGRDALHPEHGLGRGHLAPAGLQVGVARVGAALLADLLQALRVDGQAEQLAPVGAQARGQAVAFIDAMASAYAEADLVIARAGAMTVSEIACVGVASVLVPYPHAVDDHQTANAKFLATAGGAIVLPQDEMTPESVSLIRNYGRGQMLEMAQRARALAKPDAAEAVARVCAQVCKSRVESAGDAPRKEPKV